MTARAWSRDNIAASFGNQSRVTIVAEAAGAVSVGTLRLTPSGGSFFPQGTVPGISPAAVAAHGSSQQP